MSIAQEGLKDKLKGGLVLIEVSNHHPLIKLGNLLPWEALFEIILPDLQASTLKGQWHRGRALKVRIHLGVYLLQQLLNKKDRQIEEEIKMNAAYQIFCGREGVETWHCPDHTKIEAFRSRLRPQTQQKLANALAQLAVKQGYACAHDMDIDSTVQQANCSYPRDGALMVKLANLAYKVGKHLDQAFFPADFWRVDLKGVKAAARHASTNSKEGLRALWQKAQGEVSKVVRACYVSRQDMIKLPWFIKRALDQLQDYSSYFMATVPWVLERKPTKGKPLCFHLKEVACFKKKGQSIKFGRSHQLGRLKGNFMIIASSNHVRMEDKTCLPQIVELHKELFGPQTLTSVAADGGYASRKNKTFLENEKVQEIGLRLRGLPPPVPEIMKKLTNRRAGIEPLIGHLKRGGQMGQTRMKRDDTGLSSAYTSVLGFNLRQVMRYQALEGV